MRKSTIFLLIVLVFAGGSVEAQRLEGSPKTINDQPSNESGLILFSENDGGLFSISSVPTFQCTSIIQPLVEIVNNGSNLLTSAILEYSVDAGPKLTIPWSGSLEPGATDMIQLPEITVTAGSHVLMVSIIEANGTVDINGWDNDGTIDFHIVGISIPIPILEGFDAGVLPEGYFIENHDSKASWNIFNNGAVPGQDDYMMQMHFYNSALNEVDELYIKNIDLSNVNDAFMSFDVSYRYYKNKGAEYFDKLMVFASADCGNAWDVLYEKEKDDLATIPPDDVEFFPDNASQWRTELIGLSNYVGNSNVMIRLEGISGYGNNLYVDNIHVSATVGIDEVVSDKIIELFPNPANGYFYINVKVSGKPEVRVVSMLGQDVYSSPVQTSEPFLINTADWSQGLYLISLFDGNLLLGRSKLSVIH